MTREEAIKEIEKAFEPAFANYIVEALTKGATVSEQEPCDDAVSRKAVIDMLNEHKEFISFTTFKRFIELLYKLPLVTPQEPKSEWQRDHEILKAYSDGVNEVLDKIRAEIQAIIGEHNLDDYDFCSGLIVARKIIDKYKKESEE